MKLAAMFKDILSALVAKPATEPYPNPTPDEPARLRGKLYWTAEGCTGCQLCVKDCPAQALDLFVLDQKSKQFVMRYNVSRCTFCGQCVEDCRFHCLRLAPEEWSLAADSRAPFVLYYGDKDYVRRILAGEPEQETELSK